MYWDIYIDFTKIYRIILTPCYINETRKEQYRRQTFHVAKKCAIRDEILITFKIYWNILGTNFLNILKSERMSPLKYYMVVASYWLCHVWWRASYSVMQGFKIYPRVLIMHCSPNNFFKKPWIFTLWESHLTNWVYIFMFFAVPKTF